MQHRFFGSRRFFVFSPFIIALTACGGGGGSTSITANDQDPPTVSSVTPEDGARDVSTDTDVTVKFSESMSGKFLNDKTITLDDKSRLSSAVRVDDKDSNGNGTVAISDSQPLPPLSSIRATVTTEVRDVSGNTLKTPKTWTFTTADGDWSDASSRGERSVENAQVQVVSDAFGNATVIWVEKNSTGPRVAASRYMPGSGWAGSERVAQYADNKESVENDDPQESDLVDNVTSPQFAVNEDGTVLAVFRSDGRTNDNIIANRYINGQWESIAPPAISRRTPDDVASPDVAITQDGNGLAVWSEDTGAGFVVKASRFNPAAEQDNSDIICLPDTRNNPDNTVCATDEDEFNPDNRWLAPETLASGDTPATDTTDPSVTIGPDGKAQVVWRTDTEIRGVEFDIDKVSAAPSTSTPIGTGTARPSAPKLANDAAGKAVVIWSQDDDIKVNRYDGQQWLSAAESLDTLGTDPASMPDIAVNAKGGAIAVWQEGNGIGSTIVASRFTGNNWEAAEPLSDTSVNVSYPKVGIDGKGNALAVWLQASTASGPHDVEASRLVASDTWSASELIESEDGDAKSPAIYVNGNGNATAAWLQMVNGNDRVRTSTF